MDFSSSFSLGVFPPKFVADSNELVLTGTKNVLNSVKKAGTVKRYVHTSSVAGMIIIHSHP